MPPPPPCSRQGSVDPNLLASTPDANTTDPYIQQEAAVLDYNAQNIFNFLHNDDRLQLVHRLAARRRGTLWSDAGNALDVASLGVALMRASGIPAQYVQGTLSQSQAQTLHPVDVPGQLPDGRLHPRPARQTSDPDRDDGADGILSSETESHYWFEFDTGSGWVNADPLMARRARSARPSLPPRVRLPKCRRACGKRPRSQLDGGDLQPGRRGVWSQAIAAHG